MILGAYNLSTSFEPGRITAAVKEIKTHPDWNQNVPDFDADIAVLELENEIVYSNIIRPICISGYTMEIYSISRGIVAGFGRSEFSAMESVARKLNLPIQNYHDCSNDSRISFLMSSRTICGGDSNGSGVCDGDSGSGLIVFHEGFFYLRGIISVSRLNEFNQCNVDMPSVFTDALKFDDWIKSGGADDYKK